MTQSHRLFGSSLFAQLASEVGLELLDVGSRGGLLGDFLPAAAFTDAIGFEPDSEECDRLNAEAKRNPGLWKRERHFPVALGETDGEVTLRLCQQPGCSSVLVPNTDLVTELGRGEDFKVVRELAMPVQALDGFCAQNQIQDADFMKVDVQGGELAILRGGAKIVGERLLGIRAEVEFAPLYLDQPQFSEMEIHLRGLGFYAADWIFQRHWRTRRPAEHGCHWGGQVPYSRGRLIHSDVLFLRDHHWIAAHMHEPDKKLVRLALIAILYHHLDLAVSILRTVKGPLKTRIESVDLMAELDAVSRVLYRQQLKSRARDCWRHLRRRFASLS